MYIHSSFGRLTDVETGRQWNSSEIKGQILRRASYYQQHGIGHRDRVLIRYGNCPEFFVDLLAIWTLGACAIPVDSRLTAFEVERLIAVSGASLALVNDSTKTDEAIRTQITTLHTREVPVAVNTSTATSKAPISLDDDCLILFTSGSTGEPKGVVHTHRSLLARRMSLHSHLGLEAFTRTLCGLPTNFGHGLICNCLFPWLAGCDLFIAPPFRPDILLNLGKIIDEHDVTFMSSVPSVWHLVLRAAAKPSKGSLRRIHVGSAPLSAALWSEVRMWGDITDVINAYGITETGSWTAGPSGDSKPEDGLVGRPWGAAIKVCSARNTEELFASVACKTDEEGMIWLQTPALMKGYYQRDDLTGAAVSQGWFMTGDIGVIDGRGNLYLKGRERDEINKGGMKVFPSDIDGIAERWKDVTDVCAFAFDDPAYGENIAIALVLEHKDKQSLSELHAWLKRHLAEHKMPVRWYLVDEIPRNDRGKMDRRKIGMLCEDLKPIDPTAYVNA